MLICKKNSILTILEPLILESLIALISVREYTTSILKVLDILTPNLNKFSKMLQNVPP